MTTRHVMSAICAALLVGLCQTAFAQDNFTPQPPAPGAAQGGEVSGEVAAESDGLPLAYSQRPLTLTEGTLRGDLEFSIAHISVTFFDPIAMMTSTISDSAVFMHAGVGFGITDDLEVGATLLPLLLDPEIRYERPSIYGIYRFLEGSVEVGGSLAVIFPIEGDFGLVPGIPVEILIGDNMLLGTGVTLPIEFADPDAIVSLEIPVDFALNVTPNLFFGARTGFLIPDFEFDFFTIPLAVMGGYTLESGSGGPLADLMVSFGFPAFLQPASDGDAVVTNLWMLTFGGSVYVDVM